jgi:hypothetical protein
MRIVPAPPAWATTILHRRRGCVVLLCASTSTASSRPFLGDETQAAWLYGSRLLQWQYNEGLLDDHEVFAWLLGQLRSHCGASTVLVNHRLAAMLTRHTHGCHRVLPVTLLPLLLPLLLDLLPHLCTDTSMARSVRT